MTNKFIVFEAIDGSGTSTQARLLVEYLYANDQKAKLTSEPSEGPIGHLIRELFKGRVTFGGSQQHFDRMMAHLFAADRHDHLYNSIDGVTIALQTHHVISTRYFYSSLAYHCSNKDDFNFVHAINKDFPAPDAIVYVDIDVESAIQRMSTRFTKDKYEKENKLRCVKANYEHMFTNIFNDIVVRVDGLQSPLKVHEEIVSKLKHKGVL